MKYIRLVYLLVLLNTVLTHAQEILDLEEALSLALKNNFSILLARNELEIAANNTSVGTSGFLPRIDSDARYFKSHTNSDQEYFDGRLVQRDDAVSTNFSAGVSLNWTIFNGLGMFASLDRFKSIRRSAEINLKYEIENNISSVIRSYYDIVRLYERIEVVERTLAISEERLRLTESRREVGSASKFETLQAQVDLNEDRSLFYSEELSLTNAKTTLNILLSRDPYKDFIIKDSITTPAAFNYEELRDFAFDNNSELKIASQNLEIASIERRLAASNWFPRIDLSAGYDYIRSEAETGLLKSNKTSGYNYGIIASFNLFNGFNTKIQNENAQILYESSQIRFAELRNRIESVLYNSFKRYEISLQIINLETENYLAAEENVAIGLERLRLGSITPLEFRETQINLLNARYRLVNARYEAKIAETELLKLSGRLIIE